MGLSIDVLEEHPDVRPFRQLSRTFERPHFAHLRAIGVTIEAIPSNLDHDTLFMIEGQH